MSLLILVLSLLCSAVNSQGIDSFNPCVAESAQKSCAACIATDAECGWCVSANYDEDNRLRCDTYENHARGRCDINDIQFPNDLVTPTGNVPVTDGATPEQAVQLQPQKVKVTIRPNKPIRIPLIFRQAENYPVDLYYLMDLSKSMEEDKNKLAKLGNTIAAKMNEITKNFKLGFGSFVDKVVSPFVSMVPEKLESPCNLTTGEKCVPPYGFIHQMTLDSDPNIFERRVRAAKVSGNLDAPEGGFDAIMQAVACEGEIGWRTISRRLLVFSTDDLFHSAGDGKLAGIVTPNDGACHMKNDLYVKSSELDYPSVSQIASKIKEKAVSVIFAVTEDQFPIYEQLSSFIESSSAGVLANDSSNIVQLIRENYEKITSKVQLRAQNVGKNMTVDFFSRCFGNEEVKTNECGNMKIGNSVEFDVEITITECPKDRKDWKQKLVIKPAGYQEKLELELDIICECECGKPENEIPNAEICTNGNGTFECGKCTCDPKRYGKFCECEADSADSQESIEACIAPGDSVPCSGRGKCECGKCTCFPRTADTIDLFSGPFCECDDYSCPYFDNDFCGGPKRGFCDCGVCNCTDNYSGDSCDCELSKDKCFTTEGLECNGHGKCVCGLCECDPQYDGFKCEQCLACPDKCPEYAPCIMCRVFKSGAYSQAECDLKCPVDVGILPKIEEGPGIEICEMKNDKDCWVYFTYQYDLNGEVVLKRQEKEVCPEEVNVLAIVGGVMAAIILIGLLLLLLWKLLTWIHDSREYAKFEAERMNAKWDTGENPIYKQATSTFKNPTYMSGR